MNAQPSTFALFDNNLDAPDTRGTWLLTELRESVVCRHTDDWQATLLRLEEAARNGAWVALAATYELGYLIEPRLQPLLPPPTVHPTHGLDLRARRVAQRRCLRCLAYRPRDNGELAAPANWKHAS
ncbi:MAG: hypothetical protein IPJ73_04665 [Zoogloea sp.]|nr:hypothetical protein [Zoogloea sp.]